MQLLLAFLPLAVRGEKSEVCILWKGLGKRPGPCAQTPLRWCSLEVLPGHAALLGMGAIATQIVV